MPDRRPTIAVSTAPLWRPRLEESFAAIKAAGGEGAEILVTQDEDTRSPATLERLAERHDLPIVSVHAPMLLLTRGVFTSNPLEKIRRTMHLARTLGVSTIVLHPPFVWQVRYALWAIHELQDTAGPDMSITMENMYPMSVAGRPVGFHRFQGLRGLEKFEKVTLDTSHLAVARQDIVEAYEQLRDRVVAVHLSDNRGKGRDSHAPLGEGVLPVKEFVSALDPACVENVVLEINPGIAADDRDRFERVVGASVDLVRSHLRTAPDSHAGHSAGGASGSGPQGD